MTQRNYCFFLRSDRYNRNLGCKKHDNAYGINGGGGRTERKRADLALYQHMKQYHDWMAPFAYVAVRLLGWAFFNYHQGLWQGQLIYKIFKKRH